MPPAPASTQARSRRLKWRRSGVGLLLLLTTGIGAYQLSRPDIATLMRRAELGFIGGDYEQSLQTVEQILSRQPDQPAALVLAGDASFAMEQYDRALDYYRSVPAGPSELAIHAQLRCGRIEMHHRGNAVAAESYFRTALQHDPEDRNGLFQLASLLGIQARRDEAIPIILQLFRQDVFDVDFLTLLESKNGALFNVDELQRYQNASPESPGVLVGLAWHARNSGRNEQALELLSRAVSANPQFTEARIVMADLLWQSGQFEELRSLFTEPESRRINNARFWLTRGRLAERDGKEDEAARCFWETLLQDPTNRTATYQLFHYFTSINDQSTAALLEQRVQMLLELHETSDRVTSEKQTSAAPIRPLVEQLERVGRLWEAWGWCVVARTIDAEAEWAVARARTLHSELKHAPLKLVCHPLDLSCNLSHLPVPTWQSDVEGVDVSTTSARSVISFRDDAQPAGLDFQYFNSPGSQGEGQRMYEFNGGGCGVLDYDANGWPDVHFTQGCRWNFRGNQSEHIDRLFRNLGNGKFVDVTLAAGLVENNFSTGIAVADFDNDGFDDVYVANIGPNRLFRNNGDGTFHDVSDEANVGDPRWSTSSVVADLNGDSLPDIYSVNYLEAESIFEVICHHQDGHPRMCMPFHFPAAQDQLYLNLGDGRFRNATAEAGLLVPHGKGLGVIAADWEGSGRLCLLVANDTVANSFFVNRGPQPSPAAIFEELAMPTGIALNHAGLAEGCMGIAAGDVDQDGDLDVFVTNFLHETNTLYEALPGLGFADTTQEAGLAEPSRQLLGFGTQFLDADLDGRLDLLVVNGHIDDYRRYGRPYRMCPEVYYNEGDGRFSLQPGSEVGPYFTQQFLGRSLARWDWNRDGREDAVISNLDQPAALLTNTTTPHGQSLSLRLRGTDSSRDAIGTTVVLHLDRLTISRQLTAGDGYQASNERRLVFGVPHAAVVKRIDIKWPSGKTDSCGDLEMDAEYLAIEGLERAFRLDRSDLASAEERRREE